MTRLHPPPPAPALRSAMGACTIFGYIFRKLNLKEHQRVQARLVDRRAISIVIILIRQHTTSQENILESRGCTDRRQCWQQEAALPAPSGGTGRLYRLRRAVPGGTKQYEAVR